MSLSQTFMDSAVPLESADMVWKPEIQLSPCFPKTNTASGLGRAPGLRSPKPTLCRNLSIASNSEFSNLCLNT